MIFADRVIALELRASRVGFVVFEGPNRLLDWGIRSFGETGEKLSSTLTDRILVLLEFYRPKTVVVRNRPFSSFHQRAKLSVLLSATKTTVSRTAAEFCSLTTTQIRDRMGFDCRVSKHDVAKRLADQFEELSFRLPHKRKVYESEAPAMLVFDALATGVAFFLNR